MIVGSRFGLSSINSGYFFAISNAVPETPIEKVLEDSCAKERLQAELDIPIQSIASISKLTSFLEKDGNLQEQANLIKNYYSE